MGILSEKNSPYKETKDNEAGEPEDHTAGK
jgi:hypothetical protein